MKSLFGFIGFGLLWAFSAQADNPKEVINQVLNQLHTAAANANQKDYFSLFTEDAVFIGTDAEEVWTLRAFKSYAMPYFAKGKGWTYTMTERHIYLSPSQDSAWFDEMLWNDKYGVCRGTGVLLRMSGQWRIAQYHLTFPVPNELASEITSIIKNSAARQRSSEH